MSCLFPLWLLACSPVSEPVEPSTDTLPQGPILPPSVAVDPEVATLLVVRWNQEAVGEAWLSWTLDGVEHRSPARLLPAGPASELVLGVPAETRVDDVAIHQTVDGVDVAFDLGSATTGPLPDGLVDPTLVLADPASMRPERWLLTSVDVGPEPFFGPCYTVIVDAEGRIVWYRKSTGTRLSWQTRVSRGGDTLLIDESVTYAFNDPGPPGVVRLTLDHAVDEAVALPGMFISWDELDDGGFVYGEHEDDYAFHLVRRSTDGTTERLWSCFPWIEPYTDLYWGCATNTTLWHPERQTVTWSTFRTNLVLEVDLAGQVVEGYGPYPGDYGFEPPESAFILQHFPNWTADGTLILSAHDQTETRQVAREYEVDEAAGLLREIWSAETPDFAEYGGQIQALPSGNRLWQLGTAGVIQELTREGEVVWRIEWPRHLVGNTTPIADLYVFTR